MALSDKKANIFVGFDFKYHMKLSTSGILYLERLTQNTRILKFDSSSMVNIYIYIYIYIERERERERIIEVCAREKMLAVFCLFIFAFVSLILLVSVFVRAKSFRKIKKINRFKIVLIAQVNYILFFNINAICFSCSWHNVS